MGKTYTFSNVNFAYFTTILYASKKEMKPPPFQFNFVNLKMFAARKMTTVIGRRMLCRHIHQTFLRNFF